MCCVCLCDNTYESAGVVVASGGGVAEGLEQRAGGRERAARAAALAARHHRALQAHARRLRLARAALACRHTGQCDSNKLC